MLILNYSFGIWWTFESVRNEGNVLFNDALNILFTVIWVRHMVKDHSDRKRGNLKPPVHELLFLLAACGLLYTPSHRHDSPYTPVMEQGLE